MVNYPLKCVGLNCSRLSLTYRQFSVPFLGEANHSTVLTANLGELDLTDFAELIAQRLPSTIGR